MIDVCHDGMNLIIEYYKNETGNMRYPGFKKLTIHSAAETIKH